MCVGCHVVKRAHPLHKVGQVSHVDSERKSLGRGNKLKFWRFIRKSRWDVLHMTRATGYLCNVCWNDCHVIRLRGYN